jgi:hypothetical protein
MEWATVAGYFSPQDSVGAFNSALQLPEAGRRNCIDGSLEYQTNHGFYWSSTPIAGDLAGILEFHSTHDGGMNPVYMSNRAFGSSVRCVKD